MHVPTVTLRRSTERPETMDCGSNIVSDLHAERISAALRSMNPGRQLSPRLNTACYCPFISCSTM